MKLTKALHTLGDLIDNLPSVIELGDSKEALSDVKAALRNRDARIKYLESDLVEARAAEREALALAREMTFDGGV